MWRRWTRSALARAAVRHPSVRRWAPLAVALAVVLGCSLPTLLLPLEPPGNDAAQYLSLALDAYQGRDFTFAGTSSESIFTAWRWFPLWFTLFWSVLGVSLEAAVWASKVALILLGLVTLALGWRLYGWVPATVGAGLLLASPLPGNLTLGLRVDLLQAVLLLGFLAAYQRGASRPGWAWFVVAGVCLGLGQRVRESALIWLPLPLLLTTLVPGWRTRRGYLGAALTLAVVVALVAPKLIHDGLLARPSAMDGLAGIMQMRLLVALIGIPLVALGGAALLRFAPPGSRRAQAVTLLTLAVLALFLAASTFQVLSLVGRPDVPSPATALEQLSRYWDEHLSWTLPFWPLALCAWLLVGARAWRGSSADLVLLIAAVSYLPLLVATAMLHWEARYVLVLHALSAIAVGSAIEWGCRQVLARGPLDRPRLRSAMPLMRSGAPLALGLILALLLVVNPPEQSTSGELRRFNELGDGAASWLRANAEPRSRLLAHFRLAPWLHFSSGGTFPVWSIPTVPERRVSARSLAQQARDGRRWLMIRSTEGGTFPSYSALSADSVRDRLRRSGARYLVLSDGYGTDLLVMAGMLKAPSFREVYHESAGERTDRQQISIYEVVGTDLALDDGPISMTPDTLERLADDLGRGPNSGLWPLTRRGVRLDFQGRGLLELHPGQDPADPRSIAGWLARDD